METQSMVLTKLQENGASIKKSFLSLKWYEWLMMSVMIVVAIYAMITSFMGVDPITGKTDTNPSWLAIVNCISAFCGVVCIFFTAKAAISNFIFATVNTVVYIVYLAYWHIYGTMILEIAVYFPMNFVSWFIWARHKDNVENHLTKSKKMNWWQNICTVLGIVGLTVLSHFLLQTLAGDSWGKIGDNYNAREVLCWLDSITFAIGIVAIFLEAFRFREQYAWWIITDIVAVALYIIKTPFDPVYLVKKTIYLIMAVIGLVNWIKLQKQRNSDNE